METTSLYSYIWHFEMAMGNEMDDGELECMNLATRIKKMTII